MNRDVTELGEPATAQEPLGLLFDQHPDPMWVYDCETLRFLAVNAAAVEGYGYSAGEFARLTLRDIRPGDELAPLTEALATLAERSGACVGVHQHQRRDGTPLWVEVRSRPIAWQGRKARLVVARDLTRQVSLEAERTLLVARKREARRQAEASASLFRSVFESGPGMLLVLRADDYTIVAASDRYLAAIRTERERLQGRRLFECFGAEPAESAGATLRNLRASLERVKATGAADVMAVQRYPIPRADGQGLEDRYWTPVNTPVRGAGGRLEHIIHRVEDVTEFVRAAGGPADAPGALEDRARHLAWDIVLRAQEVQQANRRLQEREAMLRNAQRLAAMGSWQFPQAGETMAWSEDVYRIYGQDPVAFQPTREAFMALVHPDDRERLQHAARAAAAGGAPMDVVHRILRPDGEVRHLHAVAELIHTLQGPVLAGAVQDVTEQVRSAADAAAAFDLLRIAGRVARLGGWRYRAATGRLQWSPETCAIHELPEGSAPSVRTGFSYYLPEDRERVAAAFLRCVSRGSPLDVVGRIRLGEGEVRWVRMIGEAECDAGGRTTGARGAFQDITELVAVRQHSEDLAREQQRTHEELLLLQSAVARQNDMVMIMAADRPDGSDRRIVYVNEALERRTGYGSDELVGRPPRVLYCRGTDQGELARIDAAIARGEPVRAEHVAFAKDGRPYWVEVDIAPISSAGTRTHWVAVQRDITERKEAEERMERLQEQLRQAQRLDAVGQLTGGVAHDFNNLLTVILGNAEILAEELAGSPALHGLAETTLRAATRGAELTSRLLSFARKQALQPAALDINALVAGMEGLVRRTLGEQLHIDIVPQPGLWPAHADGAQLESAILNLCINARDAMAGGGRLTLATRNVALSGEESWASGAAPGEYVQVSVADTGTGMDAETLARAFEPFFTTKEVGKGSGLGLSMVYGFAKQSRGHVAIDSTPGQGTVVRLYLPRDGRQLAAATPEPEPPLPASGGEAILVVEDQDLVRQHVQAQLRAFGYRVQAVANAREALQALAEGRFGLLFTDIVMPGELGGRELAETARRLQPGLPVLFTSGYAQETTEPAPSAPLLHKPYRRQQLAEAVRQALEQRAQVGGRDA